MTLSDDEFTLEPQCASHAEAMYAVLTEPGVHDFLDADPPASVDALRERYRFLEARESPDGEQGWLNWVVRDSGGGVLGVVQATTLADGSAWVAYIVAPSAQGRGVGTRATRAMLEHLRAEHGVTRFLATVEERNAASIRLLEKLDFRAATEAECEGHDLTASERLFVLP